MKALAAVLVLLSTLRPRLALAQPAENPAVDLTAVPHDRVDCDAFAPLASNDDLRATPRESITYAENLAVTAIGGFVASEADYLRIRADVSALPSPFSYVPPVAVDGKALTLQLDPIPYSEVRESRYLRSAYRPCALRVYDLHFTYFQPDLHVVHLFLKGTYNTRLLVPQFRRLPGVVAAYADQLSRFNGPTYCLTAEGAHFHYLLDDASGDCPAGCQQHTYYHFESLPGSKPQLVTQWTLGVGAPPEDIERYEACLVFDR